MTTVGHEFTLGFGNLITHAPPACCENSFAPVMGSSRTRCRRCETFLIDPPFLFTAGSLFALVARRRLVAKKPNLFGLSAWVTVGFALFFWISVSWFVINSPDWMLSYFIPATELHMGAVHTVFAISLVLAGLSGHTLTAACLQRGGLAGAVTVLSAGAVVWGGLWVFSLDRYMAVGTHAEFVAGTAAQLQQSPIINAMNMVGAAQGIIGVGMLAWLYTSGRQLKAR